LSHVAPEAHLCRRAHASSFAPARESGGGNLLYSCLLYRNQKALRLVNHLLLALGAMFFQQTFIALGRALPAVIAPAIIADLRIDAAWIGIYFALTAASSLVAQLGCGSFIVRHGALRMSQIRPVRICLPAFRRRATCPWCSRSSRRPCRRVCYSPGRSARY
jgi:hypothetical protein